MPEVSSSATRSTAVAPRAPVEVAPFATPMPHEVSTAVTAPAALVEAYMRDYLRALDLPENLRAAIEYALLLGGKRLRPILAVHSCACLGGEPAHAFPAAGAVEMIHAFSLVHDDLPALDNDDLRRGRPTAHVQFGEAMAVLAGDGLMSLAFQLLAERCPSGALAGILARELATGTTAMIAGQVLDTLGGFPDRASDRERLRLVHSQKTGALITRACRMGAMCAFPLDEAGRPRLDTGALDAITVYAEAIGLMFQIVDDLLDVEQSPEHTGKRTAKDENAGKLTYPGVLGVEESRRQIERLRLSARNALARFGSRAEPLVELCDYMAVRTR